MKILNWLFPNAWRLPNGDPAELLGQLRRLARAQDRYLGHSHQGKLLVVVHTERGDNIRLISARPASHGERKDYEESNYSSKAGGPEMREEYDFSRGVRGKYARRYARGTNVVVLEADVAKVFPSARAVNDSLRALAGIIRSSR